MQRTGRPGLVTEILSRADLLLARYSLLAKYCVLTRVSGLFSRNLIRRLIAFWAILLMGLLVSGCHHDAMEPENLSQSTERWRVEDAYYRLPPPGLDKTSAYFELHNDSPYVLELQTVRSSQVRAIELHEIIAFEGEMRMRRKASISVAPGTTLSFAPGGLHLMLFGLFDGVEKPAQAADQATLRHGSIDLQFEVRYPEIAPEKTETLSVTAQAVDIRK